MLSLEYHRGVVVPGQRLMRPTLLKTRLRLHGALLVMVASMAYLTFGIPDGMLGVAWPSMSSEFGVPVSSLGLLILALTAGYGAMTFSSGRILQSTGPAAMVISGALLMAAGLLGYTVSPNWPVLLVSAVVAGMGVGAIDGGLNVFAALNFSARSTNWMHGSYAIGASAGPAAMTGFLVTGASWQWGFVAAAVMPFALACAFALTRSRWTLYSGKGPEEAEDTPDRRPFQTLRIPLTWLGIVMFIVYTGLEVVAGQWTFTLLTEERGLSTGTAGSWVTAFFVGLATGRIGLGAIASYVSTRQLLRLSIAVSVAAAALFWLDAALWLTFAALFTMGLAFGPVFPSLISTTPARVGRSHTPNAVGFQVAAAAVGAASLPALVGVVSEATSLEAVSVTLLAGSATLLGLYEMMEWIAVSRRKK